MCFQQVAWCEFCNFERPMSWERCDTWLRTFSREVKYAGVFSSPPIPSPEACPRRERVVVLRIRPGSCPSGPPPAFVREERLRRRGYTRHFGYPDDSEDDDLDAEGADAAAPFGIRGSAVNGCVGYEVRARLLESAAEQWEDEWTHRNLRARMGLDECGSATEASRRMPQPRPVPMLDVPPSSLEVLPEGVAPTRPGPVRLSALPPPRDPIPWTHKLALPLPRRRARPRGPAATTPGDRVFSNDEEADGACSDSSLDLDALSLGTESVTATPAPVAVSPQPQRRRGRAAAVIGGRENLDLVLPRMGGPSQPQRPRQPVPETSPASKTQPFQRPRSYAPRVQFAMPDTRRRHDGDDKGDGGDGSFKASAPIPIATPDMARRAAARRDRHFTGPMMVPNWDWGRFSRERQLR